MASTTSTGYSAPTWNQLWTGSESIPNLQQGDQNMYWSGGHMLYQGLFPTALKQIQYANSLEPQREAANSSMLNALNPSNLQQMLSAYNTASNQAASATAYRAAQSAANSGLSSGAQQGARQDVYNQAAAAQNSNMQNVLSPQGLANAYSAYQNAISNGMTSPYVSQLLQLQAGTPSFVSSGNGWSSLLGGLSSLAGAAGSLGWSPFSSAGGTGDTDTPNTYQPISESGYETSPEGYMYSTPNDYYAYGLGY